jgi:integrase
MGFSVFTPPNSDDSRSPKRLPLPRNRHRYPEYIYQTDTGLLIFRMKVPRDCRSYLCKKELQYSLRTRCIYSARKHIASILPLLQGVFEGIRQGVYSDTSQATLSQTITKGIHHTITDPPTLHKVSIRPPSIHDTLETDSTPTPSRIKDSPPTPTKTQPLQVTFSELQEAFFREKELSNGWRLKTLEDHGAVFALFMEASGDLPLSTIDKSLMRDFKQILIQLPPNMRKVSRFKDKPIREIIAMKPEKTLSAHTINKYLSRLSNIFSYAVTHGYMTANPAGGLKVKLKIRPDEEREAYTTNDLKKLLDSNLETTPHPYCHWTPLIALYSGCRLEEICQLHLDDIRQEGGVMVFDINDKQEKNLKTLSSSRLIPIHPQLIEIGLIKYADTLKARGETRLFPELRQQRDGYGQTVSKWFQRYKKRCRIVEGKTFHSFRHTFITHLKHKQVDPYMIHEIDGHTIESETMGRYGKRYTPEILLREAIVKIDYGINL